MRSSTDATKLPCPHRSDEDNGFHRVTDVVFEGTFDCDDDARLPRDLAVLGSFHVDRTEHEAGAIGLSFRARFVAASYPAKVPRKTKKALKKRLARRPLSVGCRRRLAAVPVTITVAPCAEAKTS